METEKLQLDEIVDVIEGAFGEAPQPLAGALDSSDIAALKRIFSEINYEDYMQDQVNRQIIRDYLINAVVLGVISRGDLAAFADHVASEDGRAAMALHMLMSSVEEARQLPLSNNGIEVLQPLRPVPGSRPHMKLVPN